MAGVAFDRWAFWNNCSAMTTVTTVDPLVGTAGGESGKSPPSKAVMTVRSTPGTSPLIQVVALNLTNGAHVPDTRMAKYTWDFVKKYKRDGALTALPAAPKAVIPTVSAAAAHGLGFVPVVMVLLLTLQQSS
jgi:hypothetical protein